MFDLAAAYAFGIIRNHPFVDCNERTGFLAAYVFLYLNGWELMASEAEAVAAVLALAMGEMDEAGFSNWLTSQFNHSVHGGIVPAALDRRDIALKQKPLCP